jgi:hypothetical protein
MTGVSLTKRSGLRFRGDTTRDPAMLLSRTEVEAATRPLSQARSMPAGFYTDPEIFNLEREHVFLKHWFFAAREDQLAASGSYKAIDTNGGPVVLVRRTECCAPSPMFAGIVARSCLKAKGPSRALSVPITPGATSPMAGSMAARTWKTPKASTASRTAWSHCGSKPGRASSS